MSLLAKLVPLTRGNDPERFDELASLFEYANWNFAGAGLWSVPTDTALASALSSAFLLGPQEESATGMAALLERLVMTPMRALETRACRLACPWRWPLRALVFVAVLASLVIWVVSFWRYELKRVYDTRTFGIARAVIVVALFATLWCDPYWSQRQAVILFVFLIGLVAYATVLGIRRNRERNYP